MSDPCADVRRLLSELDRLGVELRADGDRLRYSGTQEAVTVELLDRIGAHKAELLGLLAWYEDEALKLFRDTWASLCAPPGGGETRLRPDGARPRARSHAPSVQDPRHGRVAPCRTVGRGGGA